MTNADRAEELKELKEELAQATALALRVGERARKAEDFLEAARRGLEAASRDVRTAQAANRRYGQALEAILQETRSRSEPGYDLPLSRIDRIASAAIEGKETTS